MDIPDAPLIREEEAGGTDYMYEYLYGDKEEEDGD